MNSVILILYPLLCIVLPCFIYIFLCTRKPGVCLTKSHFVWVCIFLLYLYMVLDTTGIGSIWDIGSYDGIITMDKINVVLFRDGIELSQILNVIMFMPLGFLLPLIWKNMNSPLKALIAGAGYSFAIEFCQLFNNRVTDINDLIMNTLGALMGYFIWLVFAFLFHPKGENRQRALSSREAAAYLTLSILGEFLFFNWRWMVRIFFQ